MEDAMDNSRHDLVKRTRSVLVPTAALATAIAGATISIVMIFVIAIVWLRIRRKSAQLIKLGVWPGRTTNLEEGNIQAAQNSRIAFPKTYNPFRIWRSGSQLFRRDNNDKIGSSLSKQVLQAVKSPRASWPLFTHSSPMQPIKPIYTKSSSSCSNSKRQRQI